MPTSIPIGDARARKIYSVALFHSAVRKGQFSKYLSGVAPAEGDALKKARSKEQSPAEYPIVRVTDLSKQAGEKVSVDAFNIITGKPIMGDKKITSEGLSSLSFSSMEILINQVRRGVDIGGRMSQQRTTWNLRNIGKAALGDWYARFDDQTTQVHLAGARGSHASPDWVVPLATDADFSSIMVNSVVAPTYNRHLYGGNATAIDTIDAADIITLDTLDRVRTYLDELDFPMQPVKLPDDPAGEETPLYVMILTNRQWHWLSTQTGATAWRTFLMNARERASKNPLFTGECGMWNGILIKKVTRPIRFNAGDSVTVATSVDVFATTTKTVAAGVTVERAMVLGAQALGNVYGRNQSSDFYFDWFERKVAEDHDNSMEVSVAAMNGKAKLRFNVNGVDTDNGVLVIDSSAPNPNA